MAASFLEATRESGKAFFSQDIPGEVLMLNLLRFRDVADYAPTPELMPDEHISGRAAYQRYVEHTLPLLGARGGAGHRTAALLDSRLLPIVEHGSVS